MAVPRRHEIQPTLLHPAGKVLGCNLIWVMENALLGREDFYRSLLYRNASAAQICRIWWKFATVEITWRGVVLNHQGAASLHELQQSLVLSHDIFLRIVRADSQDNRAVLRQILGRKFLGWDKSYVDPQLL